MSERVRALGRGTLALAKSALLIVGVPIALWRLIELTRSGASSRSPLALDVVIRLLFLGVGLCWILAVVALFGAVVDAVRGTGTPSLTWSARWASAIAGLVIVVTSFAPSSLFTTTNRSVPAARGATTAVGSDLAPTTELAVVGAGECLSDLALRHLGSAESWPLLAEHNLERPMVGGGRFVDPNLLREGWCLLVPPGLATASRPEHRDRARSGELEELALLGLGVLTTAALVRRTRALRTAARSARPSGSRRAPAGAEVERAEARLEPLANSTLLDWIEVANRMIRLVSTRAGVEPDVRVVRAGPDGITFFFAAPVELDAAPFLCGTGGWSWTLPMTTSLAVLRMELSGTGRLVPWLIPLGDDGNDAWLIAVGPGRRLLVDGDPERAAAVLGGIVTALRTLPWADELDVELLGIAPPPLAEHCYQCVTASQASLAELAIEPRPKRGAPGVPPWRREPLVVVAPDHAGDPVIDQVGAVAGVIALGTGDAFDRIVLAGDRAVIEPLGLELRVPAPGTTELSLLERLLDAAATEPSIVPFAPPAGPVPERSSAEILESVRDAPLRLLLPRMRCPAITSHVPARDESRVVELLAFVDLHGGFASRDEVASALFPKGGDVVAARLAGIVSAARRACEESGSLAGSLVVHGDGSLTLDERGRSEWRRIKELLTTARACAPEVAIELLSFLLELQPAPPAHPYTWMRSEGLVDDLVFELCDAWHQLAALALADGRLGLAERAIMSGLELEPTAELLVRDLMVLRDLERDRTGVLECFEALETALLNTAGVEPSEETRRLFEALARDST